MTAERGTAQWADATTRVLLLVEGRRDRELLADRLGEAYDVRTPDPGDDWGAFDCCLVDAATYSRVSTRLAARKRAAEPVFTPVLLLAPATRSDSTASLLEGPADDVVFLPTDESVVLARLESVLHARRLSLSLADERDRFQALAESASDGIVVVDADATVDYANPAVESMLGYAPERLEGASLTELMPERSHEPFRAAFERYLETDERRLDWTGTEFVARHDDGHEVPVEVSFAEFERGGSRRITGIIRDVTERKALEASLRAETDLLARVFDTSPVAITVLDADGTIVRANETAERILGLERSDIAGRTFDAPEWEIVDADGEPIPSEDLPFARVLANDEPVFGQEHGIRVDGDERWLSVNAAPLPDDDALAAVAVVQDVTERRARQRALREEKALVENLFDAVPDTFFVLDTDGDLVRWNRRLREVTGYTDAELADLDTLELVAPEDRARVATAIQRIIEETETVTESFGVLPKSGEPVPFEVIGTPLTDEDGTVTGLVGTGRDQSEREQRRRELERFELIVQTAGDPIYTLDADGNLTLVNDALVELLGSSREELLGQHVSELLGAEHAAALTSRIADLQQHSDRRGTFTSSVDLGAGHREFQTHLALKPSSDGFAGCVCVSRDITELVEHERRLSVLDRVLRHNLRNKLNIVLAYANDLAEEGEADGPARKIVEAAEALLSLSESARRFQSSISPGRGSVTAVDIVPRVEATVDAMRIAFPEATFRTDVPESAVGKVHESFDVAVEELIENALVHSDREEPTVEVTVRDRPDADRVELVVADDGPGIAPFERRVLLRGEESPLEHTNGLGLWLVRWVVSNSAGDFDIRDNEPRGTVVALHFERAGSSASSGSGE